MFPAPLASGADSTAVGTWWRVMEAATLLEVDEGLGLRVRSGGFERRIDGWGQMDRVGFARGALFFPRGRSATAI